MYMDAQVCGRCKPLIEHVLKSMIFIVWLFLCFSIFLPAFAMSPAYLDTSLSADIRATDLVSRMTSAEKISQLGTDAPSIGRLGIKGYQYQNEALHGVFETGTTVFPQVIGLSSTWDDSLIQCVGSAISDEARILNKTQGMGLVYFAPNANMARDPRWGRNEETYGEDPFLGKKLVVSFIKGMQGNDPRHLKTIATVKHFACNNEENGRYGSSSNVNEADLRQYFLPVFEAAVREGGVGSVMGAYNSLNGIPCCSNVTLLDKILRKEWGFTGFVVSDCGAIGNICKFHHYVSSFAAASVVAIRAGCDLCCGVEYQQYLPFSITTGLGFINMATIDTSVKRIFTARIRLGEFDPPGSVPYDTISISGLADITKQQLALRAAHESIVLLKNNGILPLNRKPAGKIAIIGPNAAICRFGGYSGVPVSPVTPLQGIIEKIGQDSVIYAQGCAISGSRSSSDFDQAISAAKKAGTVIIFLGTSQDYVGEAIDLPSMELPGVQQELVEAVYAANSKLIVVLVNGNPLTINWIQEHVPAIIESWEAGQSQGTAIADVLFGDYNPGGKLSTTWVKSQNDLPGMKDYNVSAGRTYQYFSGTPLYPFGYGLSYTTFDMKNLVISSVSADIPGTVSVDVQNTGNLAGDEVVQLYLHCEGVGRPIKQLKGFRRVSLLPGQMKTVSFSLPFDELSFWDVSRHAFVTRKGEWDVLVGGSSSDIKVTGKISVTGDGLAKQSRSQSPGMITINRIGSKGYSFSIKETGKYSIDIMRLDGRRISYFEGKGAATFIWQPLSSGIYLIKVRGATYCKNLRVCIER
jgi:beta-glucosidase